MIFKVLNNFRKPIEAVLKLLNSFRCFLLFFIKNGFFYPQTLSLLQ